MRDLEATTCRQLKARISKRLVKEAEAFKVTKVASEELSARTST